MSNVFAATSDAQMRANIRAAWHDASEECKQEGRDWYPRTHQLAAEFAAASGVTLERVAAALALLSPRSSWSTNKRNVATLLIQEAGARWNDMVDILDRHGGPPKDGVWRLHEPVGLPENVRKAREAIRGEPLAGIGFGQKTRAFWSNIEDPVFSDDVTVDSWACGVALGRRLSNQEMSGLTARHYLRVADAYRAVARTLRPATRPSVVQAGAWCWLRGQSGWSAAHNN